jgi:hypothetical protein
MRVPRREGFERQPEFANRFAGPSCLLFISELTPRLGARCAPSWKHMLLGPPHFCGRSNKKAPDIEGEYTLDEHTDHWAAPRQCLKE